MFFAAQISVSLDHPSITSSLVTIYTHVCAGQQKVKHLRVGGTNGIRTMHLEALEVYFGWYDLVRGSAENDGAQGEESARSWVDILMAEQEQEVRTLAVSCPACRLVGQAC